MREPPIMPENYSENPPKSLREILTETLDLRGLTIERLSELADIPERYLLALRDGNFKKLPAAPYVRGYLMRIGQILNIDGLLLWDAYKNQNPVKSSGVEDRLPTNRFAIQAKNKKYYIIGVALLIIIAFLVWRGNDFFGTPQIDITNPVANTFVTNSPLIKLTGRINPRDKLTINNEEVGIESSGRFEKDFPLQSGPNPVEFRVKRFLGKETKVVKQIMYQP